MIQPSKLRSIAVLTFALSATLSSAEARSISEIKKSEMLVVGITSNVPPFQMKVADLNVGFEIEMVRALAADMGLNVKFKEIPSLTNLMTALANDEVDTIVNTLAITSTREKGGDFTSPYACLGASILTSNPGIKTVSDLHDKTMSLVSNTAFLSYAKKQEGIKNIIEYPTVELVIASLKQKESHATVAWKAMIPFMNKVYKLNFQETPVLWSIPVGLLVHENNDGLRLAINTAILRTQRDGTFDKLDKKYFADESVKCKK